MKESIYSQLNKEITLPGRKKKQAISAWNREDRTPVKLCKGAEIDESVYDISENRYYTLIAKGVVTYMITAGGIGAYLTAFDVEFNQIIFNLIVFVTAVICAMLYHSFKSENLGYLLFFAIYAASMFLFRDYLNSGFYAVMNDTIDWASIYFNTEGFQYYNERIANRYVAITISMSLIGIAINVLLNNYILRRARYVVAIGISLSLNMLAFYMEREPDTIYTIMVLFGILLTYLLKCGRHFYLSRRDHIFQRMRLGLTYALDYKSLIQGIIASGALVLVVVGLLSTIYDKNTYDSMQTPSEEKQMTREGVQNFVTLGVFGLIDRYPSNGGLSTGELGGVSSIRLDYMTDITILYTPYSLETLYIKNFTGDGYLPYSNKWNGVDYNSRTYQDEVQALKEAYENGDEYSAHGYMTITNVEAQALPYQPYYSDGGADQVFYRQSESYSYYPRTDKSTVKIKSYKPDEIFLKVPDENKAVIDDFIEEAGFTKGDALDVADQVKNYFQENIPYTIRPGATPWREDFINFFLTDNRKGYCAHFASAATLIFREMGIPARYCEGYAVSFNQMTLNGELVEDADYSNYYDGYNELGETALVRLDVSDASAHAWVEVFDENMGWVTVEVTPSTSIDEDESSDNFWDAFNNMFGDGDENNYERTENDGPAVDMTAADKIMRIASFVVIGFAALAILIFLFMKLWPSIKYKYQYSRAGLSDKLILKYGRYVKKKRKKDAKFLDKMNYTDQMLYLLPFSERDRERMIDILERAGFSNREISQADFDFANAQIEEIFREKKHR